MKRASCQSHSDLVGFYQELADSTEKITAEIGRAMLALLPALDGALQQLPVWCLTSHYELVLLSHDDYTSPWYVRVHAFPGEGYRISYRMPASVSPWPEAQVQGIGASVESAAEMVRIACEKSGGWAS